MEVMKRILGIVLAVVASLFVTKVALANEGTFLLTGNPGAGSCYIASVFIDRTYRILGTCRDLKVALTPEKTFYVLWAESAGKIYRLGPLVSGKFNSGIDVQFTRIFLTAEIDGYASRPSSDLLLSGNLNPINFGASVQNSAPIVTITPTPTISKAVVGKVTTTTVDGQPEKQGVSLSSAVSTVLKIALFGFVILLVVVGVFSFLSRKRSL
jgi:hypothetical protein